MRTIMNLRNGHGRRRHSVLAVVLVAAGIAAMTLLAVVDVFVMLNGG